MVISLGFSMGLLISCKRGDLSIYDFFKNGFYINYKSGDLLVLIPGSLGHNCMVLKSMDIGAT